MKKFMNTKVVIAVLLVIGVVATTIGISVYQNRTQLTEYYVQDTKGNQAEVGVIKYTPSEDTYEVYLPNTGKWYPSTSEKLAKVSIQMSLSQLTSGDTSGLTLKSKELGSEKDAMTNSNLFFKNINGKVYIIKGDK